MAPSFNKTNGHMEENGGMIHANGKSSEKPINLGEQTYSYMTFKKMGLIMITLPLVFLLLVGLPSYLYPVLVLLFFIPVFAGYIGLNNVIYCLYERHNQVSKIDNYIEFLDEDMKKKFTGRFIPIRDLYELYAEGKLNFKGDVLQCLERRNEYVSYKLQLWHLKFFLSKLLPELLHARSQDKEQVCDHYDRGNDFYNAYLGPLMVYTSGIRYSESDTLEDMQMNKLKAVCEKVQLKEGDRHLDIGCGWGTLVNYAAENYNSQSEGVTLAKEQVCWAEEKAKSKEIMDRVNYLCMDYRDIPKKKYDKITCLEMSEHVGIKRYHHFLKDVRNMLEDDGIFFLQIAGLRRAYQWEDFLWGFFMDTYIFPGADASLPLQFPIAELEAAGFEVESVKTVGIHYSDTIKYWYHNWVKSDSHDKMIQKYGRRMVRVWDIFLAWSTIIARQGNSTCYQIVAHKNFNHYPRRRFIQPKN